MLSAIWYNSQVQRHLRYSAQNLVRATTSSPIRA